MQFEDYLGKWEGETVACFGSGPSLTKEDCELVRSYGIKILVANTTFKMCPWADVLFGFDYKWWNHYKEDVKSNFNGLKLTYSASSIDKDIESIFGREIFKNFGTSGVNILSLAVLFGAKKILMLGYDCNPKQKTHWHGDHPEGFSNCNSISLWASQFKAFSVYAKNKKVEVVNCSRETKLECFKIGDIKQELLKLDENKS